MATISWQKITNYIVNALYPKFCICCGKSAELLCPACLNTRLYYEAFPQCPKCPGLLRQGRLIHKICRRRSSLSGVLAVCFYESTSRKLISAFKYGFCKQLGPILSGLLAERINPYLSQFDLLVPVPLYPDRQLWRGYNQSILLGGKIPLKLYPCLLRTRNSTAQATLNRKQRLNNLQKSFALLPGANVSGARILLIDDVLTTGATLEACAAVLKQAGAESVTALVFAKDNSVKLPKRLE